MIACLLVPLSARANVCDPVDVWRTGTHVETVCRPVAEDRGLTVLDLGDDWVPPVFAADGSDAPAYQATYLALAQERFDDAGLDGKLAKRDRYLELYGIVPSLGVVHARLGDDVRHACHAKVDDEALAGLTDRLSEESAATGRARIATARTLRTQLEATRRKKQLVDLDAVAAISAAYRRSVDRLIALETRTDAIRSVQAHLACDGLFPSPPVDGVYTWHTRQALATFQRGTMYLPDGILEQDTRDTLLLDSGERDFRTALRVLRARVSAASGLVEDGTAGTGEATVLARELVPARTLRVAGHDPLEHAAPDLTSAATEAAARALGWTDASAVRAFLDSPHERYVAVELPAAPEYHSATMDLTIEIEPGDIVRYRRPRANEIARRPALTVIALVGEQRIPLARWPTTIGGWQDENTSTGIRRRWKSSPVGPRVWRDLYVGPSWLPPETTPDRELVRGGGERSTLARELLGPSYRAAFGVAAFVHVVERGTGTKRTYSDEGIRTHGTGSLVSLANGVSHGCHRLLGFDIVKLANFVLAHRAVVRRGDTPTHYRRTVHSGGTFRIAIDSLGYRYELDPPIPVTVLPGRVLR